MAKPRQNRRRVSASRERRDRGAMLPDRFNTPPVADAPGSPKPNALSTHILCRRRFRKRNHFFVAKSAANSDVPSRTGRTQHVSKGKKRRQEQENNGHRAFFIKPRRAAPRRRLRRNFLNSRSFASSRLILCCAGERPCRATAMVVAAADVARPRWINSRERGPAQQRFRQTPRRYATVFQKFENILRHGGPHIIRYDAHAIPRNLAAAAHHAATYDVSMSTACAPCFFECCNFSSGVAKSRSLVSRVPVRKEDVIGNVTSQRTPLGSTTASARTPSPTRRSSDNAPAKPARKMKRGASRSASQSSVCPTMTPPTPVSPRMNSLAPSRQRQSKSARPATFVQFERGDENPGARTTATRSQGRGEFTFMSIATSASSGCRRAGC